MRVTKPKRIPVVGGMDPSLTNTGVALSLSDVHTIKTTPMKDKPHDGFDVRLHKIRNNVVRLCRDLTLVVLEGPSHASKFKTSDLGTVRGVILLTLYELNIEWVELSPNTLKKVATGKGNCDKSAMAVSAARRLGIEKGNEHEIDAIWAFVAGRFMIGDPVVELPKAHTSSLGDLGLVLT